MSETLRLRCALMRGGTSRGLVFAREALPADRDLWDLAFLAALGSPDVRQLDGVGAGDSHTSKIAVVSPSESPDADIDYLFGEVSIEEPRVDYAGNSGNIIAALGLYAVEEGIVAATDPETLVRVRNVNTGKLAEVLVPIAGGAPAEDGDFEIDGVPGRGPRIDMGFPRPDGAVTGALLPTGAPRTVLDVSGIGAVETSLVDAANPIVALRGEALGISPGDDLRRLGADADLRERVQRVRSAAAVAMGLVERAEDAWAFSNMIPFPVLVFEPADYPSFPDPARVVPAASMDLTVRVVSLAMFHKSINVTVTVAVAAAALEPGTVVHEASGGRAREGSLRIGHPSGTTTAVCEWSPGAGGVPVVERVRVGRTARRILDGEVLVQPGKLRWLRERLADQRAVAAPTSER